MTTATAKMIYADKQLAQDILGKLLEKGGETLYDLFQLPHGWQIVRVTKCPKFMPKEVQLPRLGRVGRRPTAASDACFDAVTARGRN